MKARTVVSLAWLAIVCGATAAPAASVAWQTKLDQGSLAARKTNKPILIEFWADWCPLCLVMDREVFTRAAVIQAMSKVVPVRIDVDKQRAVARKYGVATMPTLVVADSFGNEMFRFTGTIGAAGMEQLMNELPADVTAINRFAQMLATDPGDFTALDGLGRELRAARFYRSSNKHYGKALRSPSAHADAKRRGDILVAMGRNHLEMGEFASAAKAFDTYLKDHAGGTVAPDVMLGLARALIFQNKREEAKRTLQALTGRYKSGLAYTQATLLLASL